MLSDEDRARVVDVRVHLDYASLPVALDDRAWLLALVERLTARRVPQSDDEEWLSLMRAEVVERPRDHTDGIVPRFLALLDASDDILADFLADHHQLRQEGSDEQGRAVFRTLQGLRDEWKTFPIAVEALDTALDDLARLSVLPPPTPPSAARARADAACALLRQWLAWHDNQTGTDGRGILDDTRAFLEGLS